MRLSILNQHLELFKRNPQEFLHRIVTVDETWIYYYTSETKEQSKQWISLGSEESQDSSTGKVMSLFFFLTAQGVMIFIKKEKIITEQYYADLLARFNFELKKKRPHFWKKKYSSIKTLHWLTLPQSPQPNQSNCATNCCHIHRTLHDLALCNFFLFGKRFTNEEVIAETEAYFVEFDKSYFSEGKQMTSVGKNILLKGDY